jgi:hypothetical protein
MLELAAKELQGEVKICRANSACGVNRIANNVRWTQWNSKDRRTRTERRSTMQRWSMTVTWTVDRDARKTSEGVSSLLFVLLKQGLIRWNFDISVVNQVFRSLPSKKRSTVCLHWPHIHCLIITLHKRQLVCRVPRSAKSLNNKIEYLKEVLLWTS